MKLLNRADETTSIACSRCEVDYHPKLTAGECPVCGEVPTDVDASLLPRPLDDDTRMTALMVSTMALNLVILAVLAAAFL